MRYTLCTCSGCEMLNAQQIHTHVRQFLARNTDTRTTAHRIVNRKRKMLLWIFCWTLNDEGMAVCPIVRFGYWQSLLKHVRFFFRMFTCWVVFSRWIFLTTYCSEPTVIFFFLFTSSVTMLFERECCQRWKCEFTSYYKIDVLLLNL